MRLYYDKIKKRGGTVDLGKATLLQGDNGSGKSAIVSAIQLALSGKIPSLRLGKGDSQDAGRLLKHVADQGFATVDLGAGRFIGYQVVATEKKARLVPVSSDGSVVVEDADVRASVDMVFADFRKLTSCSDKERAELLSGYLPQPEDRELRAWAYAQAILYMGTSLRPKRKDGAGPKHIAEMPKREEVQKWQEELGKLAEANKAGAVLDAVCGVWKSKDITTAAELVEALRQGANASAEQKRTATAALKQGQQSDPGDPALIEQIPALESEVSTLRTARDGAQTASLAAASARKSRDRAAEELRTRKASLGSLNSAYTTQTIEAVKAAVKKAATDADRIRQSRPTPSNDKELAALHQVFLDHMAKTTEIADEIRGINAEGKALADLARKVVHKENKEDEVVCPLLGTICNADLGEWLKEARAQLAAKVATRGRIEEKFKAAMEEKDRVWREQDLLLRARDNYIAAQRDWQKAVDVADEAVRKTIRNQEQMEMELASVPAVEALITELESALAEMPEAAEPEPWTADQAERLAEAEVKLRSAHAAQARKDVLASVDLDSLETAAKVWKAAHAGAAAGVTACQQAVVTPVLQGATDALDRFGLPGQVVIDLTTETFGLINGEAEFVDIEALSAGEQVLYACALLSVLPASGPRVLIAEVAEVRVERMTRLMVGFELDKWQCIVLATCHDVPDVPTGWNVHRCE